MAPTQMLDAAPPPVTSETRSLDPSLAPTDLPEVHDARDARIMACQLRRLTKNMFGLESPAQRLGRYSLLDELGRGAMGVVYEAYDRKLDRRVAIKILSTSPHGRDARIRFGREAQGLAKLSHPNVVQIHEIGEDAGTQFLVMEFIVGQTLRHWLGDVDEHGVSVHDLTAKLDVLVQSGRGLAAAHAAGLVHRDFKPDNVMVGDDGRARVLDFGLVRGPRQNSVDDELTDTADSATAGARSETTATGLGPQAVRIEHPTLDPSAPLRQSLTEVGTIMGTPAYMAPEQLAGQPCGAHADQFAFCVVAFEALYGHRPFTGRNMKELAVAIETGEFEIPDTAQEIPARIRDAISRGLSVEVGARWPDMLALLDEIESAMNRRRSRLVGWIAGATLGATLATLGVGGLVRQPLTQAPLCAIDRESLGEAWSPSRRGQIRQAFADTELGFAAATYAKLDESLDRWAEEWVEAQRSACVATRVDGIASNALHDRRTSCLERKRLEFAGIVRVLADADAVIVAQTPKLVADLPDLGACDQPPAPSDATTPPSDPEQAERIDLGIAALAQARSLAKAGKVAQAEQIVDGVGRDAQLTGFAPLEIEVRAAKASLLLDQRDYDAAGEILRSVIDDAGRLGMDETATSASVQLAFGMAGKWSKPALEGWLVAAAEARVGRRQREHDPLAVQLAIARGRLDVQQGHYDSAMHEFERAGELVSASQADSLVHRFEIADLLAQTGRFDAAEAELEFIVEQSRVTWGPGSLPFGMATLDRALLDLEQGETEEARERLNLAEATLTAALGPDSLELTKLELARARLDMSEGSYGDAEQAAGSAVSGFSTKLGSGHELTAQANNLLGAIRFYQGDALGSLEAYRHALDSMLELHGPLHPEVALIHSNIGESRLMLEDYEGALEAFARSLDILGLAVGPEHPWLALPLKGRGQTLLALDQVASALVDLELALELGHDVMDPRELATLRFALARALSSTGSHPARARELSQQARDELMQLGVRELVTEIDRWLETVQLN